MIEPVADRPWMPGYGLLGAEEGRGLLPWSWAEARLTAARNYWVTTNAADGRPHTMPVWGVWLGDAFFFSTGRQTRKARNLAQRPECVICPERGDEAVVLEGRAVEVGDATTRGGVAAAYRAKYPLGFPAEDPLFRVEPRVVFGLIEQPEAFSGSATRWTFAST